MSKMSDLAIECMNREQERDEFEWERGMIQGIEETARKNAEQLKFNLGIDLNEDPEDIFEYKLMEN